ncbi:MAG: hypothetical protein AABX73_02545 [Nanoarchaeota archaeon]
MLKRGQTTIFIIVAVIIVAGVILIYMFYPNITSVIFGAESPASFLRNCIKDDIDNNINVLSEQGGYSEPEGYVMYKDKRVKYLCYNAQYYLPCKVQQPMIRAQFESELSKMTRTKADECLNELKDNYRKEGYTVSGGSNSEIKVEIAPENLKVRFNSPMTISKESTQSFNGFDVEISSKMYDLLMIATSIVDYESTYGDAQVDLYTQYYPNLRIEKTVLGDSSTVYVVSDVMTKESFTFASRSVAWPAGYGLEG